MVFCWYCCSYHNQVHYCETLNKWRQIDITNLIVINGPTRESVERYKNEFDMEQNVHYKLYNTRSLMNQKEKGIVEQWNKERKAQNKREEIEAEQHWEKNFQKYEQMDVIEGIWSKIKNQRL